MTDVHGILFNMQILYSVALGIWAGVLAAQRKSISGNFWGSVAIYAILNVAVLIFGIILFVQGFSIQSEDREIIYFLYMAFLIVIMPGLFSMLRGRDDTRAAIYFAILALFNASVSVSMLQRGLATWVITS